MLTDWLRKFKPKQADLIPKKPAKCPPKVLSDLWEQWCLLTPFDLSDLFPFFGCVEEIVGQISDLGCAKKWSLWWKDLSNVCSQVAVLYFFSVLQENEFGTDWNNTPWKCLWMIPCNIHNSPSLCHKTWMTLSLRGKLCWRRNSLVFWDSISWLKLWFGLFHYILLARLVHFWWKHLFAT